MTTQDEEFADGWRMFVAGLPRPEGNQNKIEGWDKAKEESKKRRFMSADKKRATKELTSAT